jgi:hypothetical protein
MGEHLSNAAGGRDSRCRWVTDATKTVKALAVLGSLLGGPFVTEEPHLLRAALTVVAVLALGGYPLIHRRFRVSYFVQTQ